MIKCSWANEVGDISRDQDQHKEEIEGHKLEPGDNIVEAEDCKSPDICLGCSCCHHTEDSPGHKEKAGDHMTEPQARVKFLPLKGLRPFHAPRPQQYAFWM